MPLTSQIIRQIVQEEIKSAINQTETNLVDRIDNMVTKLDKSQEQVDWFMSKYSKLDEDHETVSSQVANHSDRLDKLETKVFTTT